MIVVGEAREDPLLYFQFSVSAKAEIVLLSYAPAFEFEPAENTPTSEISYRSSVGSSPVKIILFKPSSLIYPLEDIGTLNISKSNTFVAGSVWMPIVAPEKATEGA